MQGKSNAALINIILACLIAAAGCAQKKVMFSRTKLNMQQKGGIIVSNSETLLGETDLQANGNKVIYPYTVFAQNDSDKTSFEVDLRQITFSLPKLSSAVECRRDSANVNLNTSLPPQSGFAISCNISVEKPVGSAAANSDLTGTLKIPFLNKESPEKNATFEFEIIILGKDLS